MTQLPSAFNSQQHDDMNDFSIAPKGKYIASIIKSDIDMTKAAQEAGDPNVGQLLKLQFNIIQGEFRNKIVFVQLNIVNKNTIAVEIAQKELATICRACGKVAIQDSNELHGIPMEIDVDIEESPNYPDKNIIRMYRAISGPVIQQTPEMQTQQQQTPENTNSTPVKKRPWD